MHPAVKKAACLIGQFILVVLLLSIVLGFSGLVRAAQAAETQAIPSAAIKYRADLTRIAHAGWGLDAPIPAFAAQIHQESAWNPQAVSRVGATGMAQFMPATASWWCELNKLSASACQPTNPAWAMRALMGYDKWLYDRVYGATELDRLWAAFRSYNGGLGHWQQEAATVKPARDHITVDGACGAVKRGRAHCAENLGYPQRILIELQPRYLAWGRGVL